MNKNKKIAIIVVLVFIILAIIAGTIWWFGFASKMQTLPLEGKTSKIGELHSELTNKQNYTFTTTLDNENGIYYAKGSNKAYIETNYNGEKFKFIVKDGNSYLILDKQETYYTYPNNEADLNKITLLLENAKNGQYTQGKENIEGKKYYYEEYKGITNFLMKDIESTENGKTRFYFNQDKLAYIKTTVGDYEETLKVDVSYDVDEKLFEIPSNYKKF